MGVPPAPQEETGDRLPLRLDKGLGAGGWELGWSTWWWPWGGRRRGRSTKRPAPRRTRILDRGRRAQRPEQTLRCRSRAGRSVPEVSLAAGVLGWGALLGHRKPASFTSPPHLPAAQSQGRTSPCPSDALWGSQQHGAPRPPACGVLSCWVGGGGGIQRGLSPSPPPQGSHRGDDGLYLTLDLLESQQEILVTGGGAGASGSPMIPHCPCPEPRQRTASLELWWSWHTRG